MIYVDTSFIAPLIIAEAASDAVEATVMKVKPGELATSHWARVEMASLIARKLVMGELDATEAAALRREFQQMLDETFRLLLPTAADYDAARDYLDVSKTGLRAGDALHLAVAANHSAKKIWSLDQRFIKAGKLLNLPISAG